MKRITLIRDVNKGWFADFNDDEEVYAALGCSIVPTAFTASAPAAKVLSVISGLNPDAIVELGEF
jgi:hypothetical protein